MDFSIKSHARKKLALSTKIRPIGHCVLLFDPSISFFRTYEATMGLFLLFDDCSPQAFDSAMTMQDCNAGSIIV